ncbi:uncharacterized protein PAE49_005575 [Odontesthes bonariensis]
MAAFVSLATCHHCPVTSTRRGLIYRDSLSALSRNLRGPGRPGVPPGPSVQGLPSRHHCRPTRTVLPRSSALKPSGSMKQLVLSHLRRLLTLSPAHQQTLSPAHQQTLNPAHQQRGLQLPG